MILEACNKTLSRTVLICTFLSMLACFAVAAEAVENVCVQCHSALPGRLGEPVAQWRGSIHAGNGIFCNGCHGGDPKDSVNAMSPARGFLGVPKEVDIPTFCGRCHVGVLQSYRESAHGTAQGKVKPNCVTCHSNHHVVKVSLELINERSCGRCHSYGGARLIKEAMAGTETRILAIERRIDVFKGKGIDTSQLEQRLFAGRNRFHTLSHVVDVKLINKNTAEINAGLADIDYALNNIDKLEGKKKLIGAAAITVVLLAAILLTMYRRTFD
ncbi:MAG: cytochrome c3 family protein [Geobacteraceae bacterium]|nr:cytochrome c3 family protein [Geobacteraceae bacterium]